MDTKARRPQALPWRRHLCRQVDRQLLSMRCCRFEKLQHDRWIIGKRFVCAKDACSTFHTTGRAIPHLLMKLPRFDCVSVDSCLYSDTACKPLARTKHGHFITAWTMTRLSKTSAASGSCMPVKYCIDGENQCSSIMCTRMHASKHVCIHTFTEARLVTRIAPRVGTYDFLTYPKVGLLPELVKNIT